MTKVETDMLFVSNTADQFMQVGFIALYQTQQLVTPPRKVTLIIFSNSPKPLYRNTKDQKLIAVIDGQNLKLGDLSYWAGKGTKTDKGEEMFASEHRPGLGLQSTLPPDARVRAGRDIDQLFMEWLTAELKSEQFAKIAKAAKLEFQIGKTTVEFTESQLNTIRAFVSTITP